MDKLRFSFKKPIKHIDKLISDCSIENILKLSKELKKFTNNHNFVTKYLDRLKELIQLLFKYLIDAEKKEECDIVGCFKDEEIFSDLQNIYYIENFEINCTLIQSLSILLVNISKSKVFLYYILSNNFVNDLLLIDYSKYDDEYYSYYVNFLKSLAMRLDKETVHLLYDQKSNNFPLVDCAINLYNYSNAMTRTVVNNILLTILKSKIDLVYEHFYKLPTVNYFCFFGCRLGDLFNDLYNNINNVDPYEDMIDMTLFINDLLSLNQNKINFLVRNSIFYYFLFPKIFQGLYSLIFDANSEGSDANKTDSKKESIIMLCIITFLVNVKDETILYGIVQLLFSDKIPKKFCDYYMNKIEKNPFYIYKWDKTFQNKYNFCQFVAYNYSKEFINSFLNKRNYYYREINNSSSKKSDELKKVRAKCEKLISVKNSQEYKETEMEKFIMQLLNQKQGAYENMRSYHSNLSKGLGIKIGNENEQTKTYNIDDFLNSNSSEINGLNDENNEGEINYECFLYNYKKWVDSLKINIKENKNKLNVELQPNVFRIILYNLFNNQNNVDVNIPLVILNNLFIWIFVNNLNLPKEILEIFHIQLTENNNNNTKNINEQTVKSVNNNEDKNQLEDNDVENTNKNGDSNYQKEKKEKENNNENKNTSEDNKENKIENNTKNNQNQENYNNININVMQNNTPEDEFSKYILDKNYLLYNLIPVENDIYQTNLVLIEKLSLCLENKILMNKIEIIYIDLICKNINSLCIFNSKNFEQIKKIIKTTSLSLIKLLSNILEMDDGHLLKPYNSFEEVMIFSLNTVAINLYDSNLFNKNFKNLSRLLDIIIDYEKNKDVIKGNIVKNNTLALVYLVSILEKMNNKNIFKVLYKHKKYNLNELLESSETSYYVVYKDEKMIIFYDNLFLYSGSIKKENIFEISEIIILKDVEHTLKENEKGFTVNIKNKININFYFDTEGKESLKNVTDNLNNIKVFIKNIKEKENNKFNLQSTLKIVEKF